jgi:hypothetical protein
VTPLVKNPRFAAGAAAIVCAVSLFLGSTRSVGKLARDVRDMFYDGVPDTEQGYTRPSVDSQLQIRADAAGGLVTAAVKYAPVDELISARTALSSAGTIAEKSAANSELGKRFDELLDLLRNGGITIVERDAELIEAYAAEFRGSQGVIEASGYNDAARNFSRTAKSFPVSVFTIDAVIDCPAVF